MKILFFKVLLLLSITVFAQADVEHTLREKLAPILQDKSSIIAIKSSPVAGIYLVQIGADVIYASADGRFIFRGDLLDIDEQKNVSESLRKEARSNILSQIPAQDFIEYSPAKAEHIIYVFTDVDCTYCQRFHRDVPELNAAKIGIRYLAYPRKGPNSDSAKIMQQVWCADDKAVALTAVKAGDYFPGSKDCENPVIEQYELGSTFGVRGTPAIFFADGTALPGYIPPKKLLEYLKNNQKQN